MSEQTIHKKVETAYLRADKAACLRAEWDRYEDRSGKLAIRRLENATLRAMGQRPGVAQAYDRFIDDCDFYAECVDGSPEAVHVEGTVLYGGYIRKSWGHFLMNSTARLWPLFESGGEDFDKIVFFAEDDSLCEPKGNFREFLSLLGILGRCVVLRKGDYRFDRLTVGEISLEMGRYVSAEFLRPFDAVREAAAASRLPHRGGAEGTEYKGIVLIRSAWNNNDAVQINVGEMERVFTASGYKAVAPENISLTELIAAMQDAREVVSFSGSTAHNALFAGDRPMVILERCALNNVYQIGIMKLCKCHTTPVDCFYQPLLCASSDNLTIYGDTAEMRRFAADRHLAAGTFSLSPRKEFARYLEIYRRHYGYGPGIRKWEENQMAAILEAYFDSRSRYGKYIDRRAPVVWTDWLSPRVLMRMLRERGAFI